MRYTLFHDLDREHRGVLRLVSGPVETASVLDGASPPRSFTLGAPQGFGDIVGRGVVHIWTGIDHVLFLLALLLPPCSSATAGRGSRDLRCARRRGTRRASRPRSRSRTRSR